MNKKIAVITGASSGMGREFAFYIEKNLHNIEEIWLIARRNERLVELKNELNIPCILINDDINKETFIEKYKIMLKQEKPDVRLLLNCAGYGVLGKFEEQIRELETGMIETNCIALTNITSITIPYMKKNARIINIASAAAFLPQVDFAVYAATKSYVLSFSRALNYELKSKKIYVTAVCPGPVNTEFFHIAENGVKRAWYKNYFMSKVEDVVKQAMKDSIEKKEISIYGRSMKFLCIASKILPQGILLKIMDIFSRKS